MRMKSIEFQGLKFVLDETLAPDEFRVCPPGRFVQELPAGLPPDELTLHCVETTGGARYRATYKLNGRIRWVPEP